MSSHRFLDIICVVGMMAVVSAFVYWIFYWDIQEFLSQLETIDWSVL